MTGVEPTEAQGLVDRGVRFAVQRCLEPPERARVARFKPDIRAHIVTAAGGRAYEDMSGAPTVMVGELWRSEVAGDFLLFVEQGPCARSIGDLQDDW